MPKSIPTLGLANWGQPLNEHLSQLNDSTNGGINKFDSFSQRPTTLTANDIGKTYLYTQTGNIHQWDGTNWKVLNESHINVKDFGAIGDGVADDTQSFKNAITFAITKLQPVFAPAGSYLITDTLTLANGTYYGVSLTGEGIETTKIISTLSGTNPVVYIKGGSGTATNIKVQDLSLVAQGANENSGQKGVGIKFEHIDLAIVERVSVSFFNYGLFFTNTTPGGFTELDTVRDSWINNCNNCIRIEQNGGDVSFHGLTFDSVWGNVRNSQIWLNHVSGFWYNGQFKFHVWTLQNGTILNSNGNTTNNVGTFQVEVLDGSTGGKGKVTGTGGRFHFAGSLEVPGLYIDDQSTGNGNQPNVFCTNYYSGQGKPFTTPVLGRSDIVAYSAGSIIGNETRVNTQSPSLNVIRGNNIESIALTTYSGDQANNGLYLMSTGFNGSVNQAQLAVRINNSGTISSYASNTITLDATTLNLGTLQSTATTIQGTVNLVKSGFNSHFNINANEDTYIRSGKPVGNVYIQDTGTTGNVVIGTRVGIGTGSPTSNLQVAGLAEYADNATAIGAGLTGGAFYRTGDILKVVH
jgi:hypothetical protein